MVFQLCHRSLFKNQHFGGRWHKWAHVSFTGLSLLDCCLWQAVRCFNFRPVWAVLVNDKANSSGVTFDDGWAACVLSACCAHNGFLPSRGLFSIDKPMVLSSILPTRRAWSSGSPVPFISLQAIPHSSHISWTGSQPWYSVFSDMLSLWKKAPERRWMQWWSSRLGQWAKESKQSMHNSNGGQHAIFSLFHLPPFPLSLTFWRQSFVTDIWLLSVGWRD